MSLHQLKKALTAVLLPAFLGMVPGLMTVLAPTRGEAAEKGDQTLQKKSAAGLSPAEVKKLKPLLDLKNQPWATIPWKYSITEARKLAAATRKPIFMVVNTGNALGCT
jgi:hypothetical protein